VDDARLLRPGIEARDVPPFPNRDGQVLMPAHLPVRVRCLVEEDASDHETISAQHRLGERADMLGAGELLNSRDGFEQVAHGVDAPAALNGGGTLRVYCADGCDQTIRERCGHDSFHDSEPVVLDRVCDPSHSKVRDERKRLSAAGRCSIPAGW
jgi:hypothetical protein